MSVEGIFHFEDWMKLVREGFKLTDTIPVNSSSVIKKVAEYYPLSYSVHLSDSETVRFTQSNNELHMKVHLLPSYSHHDAAPVDAHLNYLLAAGLGFALLKLDFMDFHKNDNWKKNLELYQESFGYMLGNHLNRPLVAYFAQSLLMPVKNLIPYAKHHTISSNETSLLICPKINPYLRINTYDVMKYFKVTPFAAVSRLSMWSTLEKYYEMHFK